MMGARCKLPHIREVEILGDEEAGFLLSRSPDLAIVLTSQALFLDRIDIVTQVT
ncbi:MAG: hypothetical protein QOJ16_3427 [Acidobacteriota bacterium]|nr:hypothetical protein [Acidobacteriota bacterium]